MARLANAAQIIVPTDIFEDYLLKPEALEVVVNEQYKLLTLCTPCNPAAW